MQKKYQDRVDYTRNGDTIPAIVLQSRFITEEVAVPGSTATTPVTTERLTLLFADPVAGIGLINGGRASAVGQTAFNVKPLEPGMVHGWSELGGVTAEHDEAIDAHKEAVAKVAENPTGVPAPVELPNEVEPNEVVPSSESLVGDTPNNVFADDKPEWAELSAADKAKARFLEYQKKKDSEAQASKDAIAANPTRPITGGDVGGTPGATLPEDSPYAGMTVPADVPEGEALEYLKRIQS